MPIRTEVADNIAEVIFDHPPVNAFNASVWNEIPEIITSLGKRQDVKVILIRAEGKGFCAGVDIKELADNSSAIVEVNKGNYETFKAIHHGKIPAAEAYRLGGIEMLVPKADLYKEARAYAEIIASKSRDALRIAKQALNGIEPFDVDANYRWEQGFTFEMYMHEDSQKARDAFVETGEAADFKKD